LERRIARYTRRFSPDSFKRFTFRVSDLLEIAAYVQELAEHNRVASPILALLSEDRAKRLELVRV
jgi:hypothetical protein